MSNDPRIASGKGLGDRLIELERRLAALEAAAGAGLLGTDQTIKACHDRLDTLLGAGVATPSTTLVTNLNADLLDGLHAAASGASAHVLATDAGGNARVDGQFRITAQVIRAIFSKSVADNSATSIFRITLNDGANDGGVFSCLVHGLIQHGSESISGSGAAKSFLACFARAEKVSGSGVNSAVSKIVESASGATDAAARDIGAVTMTVLETSEFLIDVQFTVDLTGSSITTAYVTVMVELLWNSFSTAPTLSQL